ncbi:hypothetical protein HDU79_000369 [Rhizoclosmatium sp. JEL0117]|nr:hypothetical protein HDU79_000369 [Rhizoclosmatium sp. JEL0117]
MACIKVRSGTVIVMPETGLTVRRWRDGLKWSPSRAYGNFLLYRQIESKNSDVSTKEEDQDLSPYSTPYGSTTGLQPTFTSKTLNEGTQLTENGLTKRTITVKGSDGEKYRVVSYYNSRDVMDMIRQMQQHHVNVDIASGFIRASDDVRLKEMMKKSGTDAVALVRQSYPLWKPEEFLLTTNLSPHQQAELNNSQNHKRRRRREYVSEPRLKLETALEEHGSG